MRKSLRGRHAGRRREIAQRQRTARRHEREQQVARAVERIDAALCFRVVGERWRQALDGCSRGRRARLRVASRIERRGGLLRRIAQRGRDRAVPADIDRPGRTDHRQRELQAAIRVQHRHAHRADAGARPVHAALDPTRADPIELGLPRAGIGRGLLAFRARERVAGAGLAGRHRVQQRGVAERAEHAAGRRHIERHHRSDVQVHMQRIAAVLDAHDRRPERARHRQRDAQADRFREPRRVRQRRAIGRLAFDRHQSEPQRQRPRLVVAGERVAFHEREPRQADEIGMRLRGRQSGRGCQLRQPERLAPARERVEQPAADLDALDPALRLGRRIVCADFVVLHAMFLPLTKPRMVSDAI
ncbi:hypothetical protein BamMEX5DRAFT_6458 [Burkholderia ambifaria MEX-5]|uniref:Uncharacterized protein n=1 Tax=Burkholderia ambifaria MEX-5 TaxID=396597 RepID=B1TF97_9BURK|nr:hypothetical protein BamMEX5DRAFT_6458 [Burkholderia ambifaria MEX-5]